jgi:hypothetical protein
MATKSSQQYSEETHVVYAEKRGKGRQPWRVKYKLPDGTETGESGFETKVAALNWGRDQEARIREGRWTDPNAGRLTVSEWIERWLAVQDVGMSTVDSREYLIRRFIRPAWGDTALSDLSTEKITKWQKALPAGEGITPPTARAARTLLGTILGDAASTRPPLIPCNPALRPRNRGRRTGRRLQRAPQRTWATPLQVLLIAERAALLTGRDEDFTMIVTTGYTGLRWGEVIGLEHEYARPQEIHVEWQLRELRGRFYRIPPKDDSYCSPERDPSLPVDLLPFLAEMLAAQIKEHPVSHAVAPASTAAAAGTCSLGRTAATTGAATTAAGCSGPRATDGTCRFQGLPAAWSSPSRPPPGLARRSPPGVRQPDHPTTTPDTNSPAATASRSSRKTRRSPAGCRSSPA